jgi:hypothetical protein
VRDHRCSNYSSSGPAIAPGRRNLLTRPSTDRDQERLEIALVHDVGLGLAALGAEQRQLRDVDEAVLDDLRQLAVEECQQQECGCEAVHVRVGHDDDAVV